MINRIENIKETYSLTWATLSKYLKIEKKTIFRWKKTRRIGKAYSIALPFILDIIERKISDLHRIGKLETRKRKPKTINNPLLNAE